jgi:pimeloyl-ACP methyl ester carboxylesterase
MTQGLTPEATSVVIVHGAFVDGSGWRGVHAILRRDGYSTAIVQIPSESLHGDVAATKRILASRESPILLVGHSYGGAVITEAGHDPRVHGLVYIAAFAPDRGESVAILIKDFGTAAPAPPFLTLPDGYIVLDEASFPAAFAADVEPDRTAFMAASQVPWGLEAVNCTIGDPAWKTKPSWYLLAADDRMIPPAAQRFMATRAGATVVEASGSHAIYVSHPIVVAALIEKAASDLVEVIEP